MPRRGARLLAGGLLCATLLGGRMATAGDRHLRRPVGSFAADFIEDLFNRGITGGCQVSPLLDCPGNAVSAPADGHFPSRHVSTVATDRKETT